MRDHIAGWLSPTFRKSSTWDKAHFNHADGEAVTLGGRRRQVAELPVCVERQVPQPTLSRPSDCEINARKRPVSRYRLTGAAMGSGRDEGKVKAQSSMRPN